MSIARAKNANDTSADDDDQPEFMDLELTSPHVNDTNMHRQLTSQYDTESDDDDRPEFLMRPDTPLLSRDEPSVVSSREHRHADQPPLREALAQDPSLYMRLPQATIHRYPAAARWAIQALLRFPQNERKLSLDIYNTLSDTEKTRNLFDLADYAVLVFPPSYFLVPRSLKMHNWHLLNLAIDCLAMRNEPDSMAMLDFVLQEKNQIPDIMKQCFVSFWLNPPDRFAKSSLAQHRIELFRRRYREIAPQPPVVPEDIAQLWMRDGTGIGYLMLSNTQR